MEEKVGLNLCDNKNHDEKHEHKKKRSNKTTLKAILDKESKMDILGLVDELRQKILTECTLPLKPKTDTQFLLKFLRVRKYNVDNALEGVVKYYNSIHRNIRILEGIKPSEYTEPFDAHMVGILKNRWNGSTVIYAQANKWNTKHFCLRDIQCAGIFLIEELLKDNENQVNGLIGIVDVSGLGFSHLRQLTPYELKNCIEMLLNGLPTRISGIHLLNVPTLCWPVVKVVMKLLPSKIRERVSIHDNYSSLHSEFDKEILPESLGGYLEETEAFDENIISSLIKSNPMFDSYWSGEPHHRPRRLSRKRSSLMIN